MDLSVYEQPATLGGPSDKRGKDFFAKLEDVKGHDGSASGTDPNSNKGKKPKPMTGGLVHLVSVLNVSLPQKHSCL